MTAAELASLADLLRQAAVALAIQAEISPITYEQTRLGDLAARLREAADVIADEVLAR
jgi:hypothetical protein